MSASPLFSDALDALDELRARVPATDRITDDEQGLLIAFAVSLRADCTRRRVGAVVVDATGRVIGTGRNGAAPGRPGCLSAGACPRGRSSYDQVAPGASYSAGSGACVALHAEVNAVLYAGDPQARAGGTVYVSDAPCDDCSKVLAGSGLARAVWPDRAADGSWTVCSADLRRDPIGGHYAPRLATA